MTRFKNSRMQRSATIPRGIAAGISRWICIFNDDDDGNVGILIYLPLNRNVNLILSSPLEILFLRVRKGSLFYLPFTIPARISPETTHEGDKEKFQLFDYRSKQFHSSEKTKNTRSIYAKITTSILCCTGNCERDFRVEQRSLCNFLLRKISLYCEKSFFP